MGADVPKRREIGRLLVREIAVFGADVHAERLIAVTEPAFERFVLRCGLPVRRIAGPVNAGRGHDRDVQAVLINFDVNPGTLMSVGIVDAAA